MIWICKNGHQFVWIRKGEETRPSHCPFCDTTVVDAVEG